MITIVALLSIRDNKAFEQFEQQAAAIMASYGGRIETAFRPRASSEQVPQVDEIHVLKFPDHAAFDRYKCDENLLALAPLREKAISDTAVYISDTEAGYSSVQ